MVRSHPLLSLGLDGKLIQSSHRTAFLGIPYAQPPVGDLRLRRARSLEAPFEGGKVAATSYSPFVRPSLSLSFLLVRETSLTKRPRSQCPGIGADDYGYELSE